MCNQVSHSASGAVAHSHSHSHVTVPSCKSLTTQVTFRCFHGSLLRIQVQHRKFYNTIYLLTATGLSPGGSNTVHIYTQTIHRTIRNKQYIEQRNNFGRVRPCPVLASYTLEFASQPRKKHGKTSIRVAASKNT